MTSQDRHLWSRVVVSGLAAHCVIVIVIEIEIEIEIDKLLAVSRWSVSQSVSQPV